MARFLVVDGDANAVSALDELLRLDGHEVAGFTSSVEALAALTSEAFDAVLTELDMPHVDGEHLVQTTRACHPTACVFVASARNAPAHLKDACHVFEKPLDYHGVTGAVAACRASQGPGSHGACYMRSQPADQIRPIGPRR